MARKARFALFFSILAFMGTKVVENYEKIIKAPFGRQNQCTSPFHFFRDLGTRLL